jgi:hypothetical protein
MRVTTDKNDALNFKPDVEDLESSEDEQENNEGGVYKAPRIAAAHYYEPGMYFANVENIGHFSHTRNSLSLLPAMPLS